MQDKKTAIFEAGRELFLSKRFKEIGVADITRRAGVSVGTFYNYYGSKEELFAKIYFEENDKAKRAVMASIDPEESPVTVATTFVSRVIDTLNANSVLREWYDRDVLGELEKTYRAREEKDGCFVYDFFRELLKKWRAEGKLRLDIDDSDIFALYDALIYLDTHKTEAGLGRSPQAMQYLVEFMIKGVTGFQKE